MSDMKFDELQQIVSVCIDEIVKLKEENENLKMRISSLEDASATAMNGLNSLLKSALTSEKTNEGRYNALVSAVNNVKYEIFDQRINIEKILYPEVKPIEDTINEIIISRKSMARFGDGEFAIMSGGQRHGFQEYDARLSKKLIDVIESEDDGFIIGIGDTFGNLESYNDCAKQEIRAYMTEERRNQIMSFLKADKIYANAYITRPYAMYSDNSGNGPRKRFKNLQKIWDSRNVLFVEGCETRLGVGNDLFSNANSIKRIEAPATNSFEKYDDILTATIGNANEDDIILIALGPTAGVLAYDLYKKGYQAIDIGHLDLEYEWMINGAGGRSEVKTKYNNEYPGGNIVDPIYDDNYEKQIVWKYNE